MAGSTFCFSLSFLGLIFPIQWNTHSLLPRLQSMLEARAMEVGFGKAESTLVVALLAVVIFLCAYPLGRLDDKYGPRTTFAVGMASLVAGNLTLLLSQQYPIAVFASLLFLGVHWAVIQGPMLSIVVGLAPAHLRYDMGRARVLRFGVQGLCGAVCPRR